MLLNIMADLAKLSLFIACAYALLGAYARRRRAQWTEPLTRRRLAVLGTLTLAVGAIKMIEDVVAKESGPVDEAMLVGASVVTATLVVWGMKAMVGRARTAWWEPQCYWGSSFPSGHTLGSAALSTAAALCAARIWPRAKTPARRGCANREPCCRHGLGRFNWR